MKKWTVRETIEGGGNSCGLEPGMYKYETEEEALDDIQENIRDDVEDYFEDDITRVIDYDALGSYLGSLEVCEL